jgi:hypothetical protein
MGNVKDNTYYPETKNFVLSGYLEAFEMYPAPDDFVSAEGSFTKKS